MILSKENKKVLATRSKAFLWATVTMVAPFALDFVTANISLFNFPTWLAIGFGLILAQITKWLNTPKG